MRETSSTFSIQFFVNPANEPLLACPAQCYREELIPRAEKVFYIRILKQKNNQIHSVTNSPTQN